MKAAHVQTAKKLSALKSGTDFCSSNVAPLSLKSTCGNNLELLVSSFLELTIHV